MSTRSLIGKLNKDNTVTYIYCHFDGYFEHNGEILIDHYDNDYKVDELINLGNISSLGEEIGEKQDFDYPRNKKWCLSYLRDRGCKEDTANTISLEEWNNMDNSWIEWLYLWNGYRWITSYRETNSKWVEFNYLDLNLIKK